MSRTDRDETERLVSQLEREIARQNAELEGAIAQTEQDRAPFARVVAFEVRPRRWARFLGVARA